ncbi:MAG: hypothetical protein LBU89_05215 [Fibromonadaceae bacterium]|jgi:uncharacterized protein (DUF4415 family)|nr:hypothetical protein [Fibromonadaceae bacterium]
MKEPLIRSVLKIGDQPSEQILQEINSAAKRKPNIKATPQLSKKALKEFTVMAKEKRVVKNFVNIKLAQEDIQAYKAFGKGYTIVMSNILSRALKQPKLLKELAPVILK